MRVHSSMVVGGGHAALLYVLVLNLECRVDVK